MLDVEISDFAGKRALLSAGNGAERPRWIIGFASGVTDQETVVFSMTGKAMNTILDMRAVVRRRSEMKRPLAVSPFGEHVH